MKEGALQDIKVIDLTSRLAGPFGTMMLADQGAEVIKIESPQLGDVARYVGPFLPGDTEKRFAGYFQSINRNKKSLAIDLKTDEGKEILLKLVKDADVIVESFGEGTMDKLGLSYEFLKTVNPKIVYGALRGFGDSRTLASPYSRYPSYDVVAQSMGGMIGITGPDEANPVKVGPSLGDIVPGMFFAFGILSAVHHARRTGEGQFIDLAMADAILSVSERIVYQNSITKVVPKPGGNMHPMQSPFGIFEAKDGHIAIGAPDQKIFKKLCAVIGAEHLPKDDRFQSFMARRKNGRALESLLNEFTKTMTKKELMHKLGGVIPAGPVMHIDEIKNDPHFIAREMICELEVPELGEQIEVAGTPIKMSKTSLSTFKRGPLLGENNEEILQDLGINDETIERLKPTPIDVNQLLKSV